jgi:hypothetical protein
MAKQEQQIHSIIFSINCSELPWMVKVHCCRCPDMFPVLNCDAPKENSVVFTTDLRCAWTARRESIGVHLIKTANCRGGGIAGGQASPRTVALGCCEHRTGSRACRCKEYTMGPHLSRIQPPGSVSSGSPCPQPPYLKVLWFPLCGPFRGAWPTMRSRLHPARHRTRVGQWSREMVGLVLDA